MYLLRWRESGLVGDRLTGCDAQADASGKADTAHTGVGTIPCKTLSILGGAITLSRNDLF